jgi:hypothetical protein
MQNMAEYDKKYAEYEPTPKKYAKKLKISKISKICHLKPGITAVPTPGLRIIFSVIYMQNMQNMQNMYLQNM